MEFSDDSLIRVYTEIGASADKIAAFPEIRRRFLEQLSIEADNGDAVWRLLQLRKAGRLPKDTSRRV
jgi:hypothetical protein